MANRRMFARTVTTSGRFLRLSAQSRLLYFSLGMEADDDGFVEGLSQLMLSGSGMEHLEELEQRGFVQVCDWENLVVYIRDWRENNLIRADRYTPSVYRGVYPQVLEEADKSKPHPQPVPEETRDTGEVEPEAACAPVNREETVSQPVNQGETTCREDGHILGDSRLTQVRLGKERIVQNSLIQDSSIQNNSIQNRLEKESAGKPQATEAGNEKAASPKTGEAGIEFEEKRRKALELLMNSKHFRPSRAAPGSSCPV